MREIKFRMWNTEDQIMIDGDCLAFEEYAPISQLLTDEYIMQYTGLKDLMGVDVYEGDICTAKYAGSNVGIYKNVVKWDETIYGFTLANAPLWTWEKIKVIGNIHQNIELI